MMADALIQLGLQLTRAIIPVIIIMGVVGNSFNIAILTRPTLYHHACSRYFLALASNNLFYSSVILICRLLADGYRLDPATVSLVSCKMYQYIAAISAFLSPYLIVLASIDRYCASSSSARKRQFSSVRVARWMIAMIAALFSLLFIHTLVMVDLRLDDGLGCAFRISSLYSQVFIIAQVVLFAIVAPGFMMLFGLLTIRNTKRLRVIPVRVSRYHRTERQLARMLLVQVGIQILLTLPTSVIYLISILPNSVRTKPEFYFAYILSQFLFDVCLVTPFILYLLSGLIYRQELIRLLNIMFKVRVGNRVHPVTNGNSIRPLNLSIYPPQ